MAGWDNTPRRGRRATILQEVEPQDLRRAIAEHLVAGAARPIDERIMFVNAWNEWAEGNYLEPDTDRGRSLLEAIRDGREDARQRLS